MELLQNLDEEALSYVDDIYLMDDELMEHLARVNHITLGFVHLGYKCNLKKSKIAHLNVLFLGNELSSDGKSQAAKFLENVHCSNLQQL